ncbi:MAG: diaminopimelate epimerase [Oscillospiraceae bacterium]|nr:diaminopimelate epimerase [Oscillospiraceae bacterium]
MRFWKMNGLGNDFIILNNMEEHLPVERLPELARRLCHRRLSIGADGLMVVDTAEQGGDFKMLFFNSDGTVGEMCGNGARCICRYGYETSLAGEQQTIETTAGLVTGQRIDRRTYKIRLNNPTVIKLDCPVKIDGNVYPCSYIELGDPGLPHAAVSFPGLRDADGGDVRERGRKIRWHRVFAIGANVSFYERLAPDHVLAKTFERGVENFTLACGTGAGSVATALTLLGPCSGKNIRVSMPGGDLFVDVLTGDDSVESLYLTGLTNIAAKGEVTDEDLLL